MTAQANTAIAPAVDSGQLEQLLRDQIEIYQRIEDLSARQQGLLRHGRTDRLISLLGQRQTLAGQLEGLTGQVRPWLAKWEAGELEISEPDRALVLDLLDQISVIRSTIEQHDRASTAGSSAEAALSQSGEGTLAALTQAYRQMAARRLYAQLPGGREPASVSVGKILAEQASAPLPAETANAPHQINEKGWIA